MNGFISTVSASVNPLTENGSVLVAGSSRCLLKLLNIALNI